MDTINHNINLFEPISGEDFVIDLELSSQEFISGGEKEIDVVREYRTCESCQGNGYVNLQFRKNVECSICEGTGVFQPVDRLRITIPPGLSSGTNLRIMGEGGIGEHGGRPGNLYICLKSL